MKESGIWYYDEVDTPAGILTISVFQAHVIRIDYGTFQEKQPFYETWAKKHLDVTSWEPSAAHVQLAKKEVEEYFAGRRTTFTFPYKMYGTSFQQAVWSYLVEHIGFGEVETYKDVALGVNRPKAARAVGGAVNRNPFSITVPCHRVVGSNGSLVGYGGGLDKKKVLLDLEQSE